MPPFSLSFEEVSRLGLLYENGETLPLITALRDNGLLVKTASCIKCQSDMDCVEDSGRADGYVFRCKANRIHKRTIRIESFFEGRHANLSQVILVAHAFSGEWNQDAIYKMTKISSRTICSVSPLHLLNYCRCTRNSGGE